MPTMQNSVSVAANAVSTNQLAGELYEFLPNNAQVVLLATGAATGLNLTLLAGGVTLVNDQAMGFQNRFPVVPDDIITQENIPAGARLFLTFRNTTGAAIIAFWRVDVGF